MTALILVTVFSAVMLAGWSVATILARRDPAVRRRVRELELQGGTAAVGPAVSLSLETPGSPLRKVVTRIGSQLPTSVEEMGELRLDLVKAGFRDPSAPLVYGGTRVLLAVALPLLMAVTVVPGMGTQKAVLILVVAAAAGYMLPRFVLGRLVARRKGRIVDALPDTLDLLVVCVEAGLGLNQAMMRVSAEMANVEPAIAEEFNTVNLEMRAGKSRIESLKNLARRTGVEDLSSLVSMLVQTDKFGTSVATSLRVFSDSMRVRRRQKAEEKAAKTTIKLLFPLVLCILPALFVVVVGPAGIHIFNTFNN